MARLPSPSVRRADSGPLCPRFGYHRLRVPEPELPVADRSRPRGYELDLCLGMGAEGSPLCDSLCLAIGTAGFLRTWLPSNNRVADPRHTGRSQAFGGDGATHSSTRSDANAASAVTVDKAAPERAVPAASPSPRTVLGTGAVRVRSSGDIPWAELLRRVYDVDALACPCGGRLRFIALILEPSAAQAILESLGLPSRPSPVARARSPDPCDPIPDCW